MLEEQPAAIVRRRDVVDDHPGVVLGEEAGESELAAPQVRYVSAHDNDSFQLEHGAEQLHGVIVGIEDRDDGRGWRAAGLGIAKFRSCSLALRYAGSFFANYVLVQPRTSDEEVTTNEIEHKALGDRGRP